MQIAFNYLLEDFLILIVFLTANLLSKIIINSTVCRPVRKVHLKLL